MIQLWKTRKCPPLRFIPIVADWFNTVGSVMNIKYNLIRCNRWHRTARVRRKQQPIELFWKKLQYKTLIACIIISRWGSKECSASYFEATVHSFTWSPPPPAPHAFQSVLILVLGFPCPWVRLKALYCFIKADLCKPGMWELKPPKRASKSEAVWFITSMLILKLGTRQSGARCRRCGYH